MSWDIGINISLEINKVLCCLLSYLRTVNRWCLKGCKHWYNLHTCCGHDPLQQALTIKVKPIHLYYNGVCVVDMEFLVHCKDTPIYVNYTEITYLMWFSPLKALPNTHVWKTNPAIQCTILNCMIPFDFCDTVCVFSCRLQEKVQETIEALRLAGIKVWVLTGDKHETAVSVSLSCGHFHRTMNILELVQQKSDHECAEQLRRLARR